MEIGYAAALGVPVVILTTDFQTYGLGDTTAELAFADPLIETVATGVVRAHRLGPPSGGADRFDTFAGRNRAQLLEGIDRAVSRLLDRAASGNTERPPAAPRAVGTVFVEPSPYGSTPGWHDLVGHHTADTQRRDAQRLTAPHPAEAAKADWDTALSSHTLIADLSGPEAPPGAAVLIGATVAAGGHVLAYCPNTVWTFAHGREPNWRNFMIQYSVTQHFTEADHPSIR
jgi:hypothetical protein